jgi:hypothetical protein
MDRKTGVFILSLWAALLGPGVWAGAQHQHGHGVPAAPAGKPAAAKPAGQSVTIDGFKVTFEVMSMEEHRKHLKSTPGQGQSDHSPSHSFMVTIQDTASKEIISDAKVQYSLTAPSGAKETGTLAWSGDHYGGGFNPKEKGGYQVQLRIESGGVERAVKFQYKR